MKKRILFCVHNFQHGGISKALQSLLSVVSSSELDISIFCACHQGAYTAYFRKFKLLPQDKPLHYLCVNYRELSGVKKWIAVVGKLVRSALLKLGIDLLKLRLRKIAYILSKKNYDVIVAFSEGMITRFASEIKGGMNIAWMHSDYRRFLEYGESPLDSIAERFKYIISPSEYSVNSLKTLLPEYAHRVVHLPNFIDEEDIRKKSTLSMNCDSGFDTSEVVICSVGRVCVEKQFYKIPAIAQKLLDAGLEFKWYIIGPGSPYETGVLLEEIDKHGMHDRVIWLGKQDNPYPYIAQSDVVVVLSISETFCYVIYEARVLGIPVVASDFGSAREIMDEHYGVVKSIDEIHCGIMQVVQKLECGYYGNHLTNYKYNNQTILNRFNSLINL